MAYEHSRLIGNTLVGGFLDNGTNANTAAIATAPVYATSGDYLVVKFIAQVGQTAGTLTVHVYCDVLTGTPTYEMEVYDSFDGVNGTIDRPDSNGSALSSAPNSVSPSGSSKWCSFTCTVTLTEGLTYFCLIRNTHGTPASNKATFRVRGGCDSFVASIPSNVLHMAAIGYSLDGCSTAPTFHAQGYGVLVVKFADGTLIGNPYAAAAAHANNTNSRGVSFTPTEDMVVSGLIAASPATTVSGAGIYTTGGTTVVSNTGDYHARGKAGAVRFAPTTLTGGTQYLFLFNFSASSTSVPLAYMGDTSGNLPADVLACRGTGGGYWDGTTAQRDAGTGTIDTTYTAGVSAIVDDFPAIAGGSGGMIRNPSGAGGMI